MKALSEFFSQPIVAGIIGGALMWIGGWVRTFLAKRLRLETPMSKELERQCKTLDEVVPAVNALVKVQGPQLDLLIALGEAAQGKNNGNVTMALTSARKGRDSFNNFIDEAARIKVAG